MKKIFIHVVGCELRFLDANKICNYLSKNDYKLVDKPENADIIIFFSCGSSNEGVDISLRKIKEFKNYNAELIVAGCLPDIEKEKLAEIFDGKIITTKDIHKADQLFPKNKIKFKEIEEANISFQNFDENFMGIESSNKIVNFLKKLIGFIRKILKCVKWLEKITVKIKNHFVKNLYGEHSIIYQYMTTKPFTILVARGCLGNCSYCAIKIAVGSLQSKPPEQCIQEFKRGLKAGYKDFVIVADDTGAYGQDTESSFPELLDDITKIPGKYKISIYNLNPTWVVKYIDDLEEILKRNKITIMDIPIQSGSSRILKLMRRYHDTEKMKDAILRLRKSYPDLKLFTSCIIGFPTETEEDVKKTLDFIKETSFNSRYIFPFSCRTNTEAENIEPKISRKEMLRRLSYAKKYLKKAGYFVIYIPQLDLFFFEKEI